MRLHFLLALITLAALYLTLRAEHRHRFTFAQVEDMASARAAKPYVPLPDDLPPQLRNLTPEQDAGIFSKETSRTWRRLGLPFQVDFYHQLNSNPIPHIAPRFYEVTPKRVQTLTYKPSEFNFLKVGTNPPQPLVFNPPLPDNLGFAGFYVRYPDMAIGSNPGSLDGFFSALGSCYFRAIAKDQVYGLSGRGIAINPSMPDLAKIPEEFPNFTDWWLRQPDSTSTQLVLYAILDGPSVCGAYEFRISPGVVTSVDIHASLYFRHDVARVGIDPFSSMYLFGENAFDHFNDTAHQEIHDSDGLLIQGGDDHWDWQPLSQSDDKRTGAKGYQLQEYEFFENNPKGYGLLQRDRDYQHYQDTQNLYNVRPSAWVTPHAGFGKGEVTLIERPSNDFNTDNVVMFWHPAEPIKAGDHKNYSYTIDFDMDDTSRLPLAYTKQTLINVPAPPPPAPPPFPPEPKPATAVAANPTGTRPLRRTSRSGRRFFRVAQPPCSSSSISPATAWRTFPPTSRPTST
jgi:glucans biosynthesis protein